GRIFKILVPQASQLRPVVIIEQFVLQSGTDKRLNMPLLSNMHQCIASLLFKFNCQHNCRRHKCKFVERSENVRQGRVVTAASEIPLIMHAVDDDYFLNMHGIHNAHLICETLPREMTIPRPYLSDRLAKHKELAAQLRVSGPARRAETLVRRAQTLQRN
ncbi:hypothetical protein B0H14DRAFT_2184404, partial [Mycena olivaceomarginata]